MYKTNSSNNRRHSMSSNNKRFAATKHNSRSRMNNRSHFKSARSGNQWKGSNRMRKYENNGKGGKILARTDTNWKYEDEFYGGEPYSGNETLWLDGKDIFRCVYWGKVAENINFSDIYDFLRL